MKADHEIELDVKDELQWDPNVDATDIAVSVKKGVVTLAGFVKNYADKYEAESAAKRVAGVLGVANDTCRCRVSVKRRASRPSNIGKSARRPTCG